MRDTYLGHVWDTFESTLLLHPFPPFSCAVSHPVPAPSPRDVVLTADALVARCQHGVCHGLNGGAALSHEALGAPPGGLEQREREGVVPAAEENERKRKSEREEVRA